MTRSRARWLTLCTWRTFTSDLTPASPGALGVPICSLDAITIPKISVGVLIGSLRAEDIDAVITQDLGHIVRSSLRLLRSQTDQINVNPAQERIRIEIVLKENLPRQRTD